MGREVRRVPANWDHPKVMRRNGSRGYQSMYDRTYQEALDEWLKEFDEIRATGSNEYYADLGDWLEDYTPPEKSYYRPWSDDEATWFQVWETVSEGTPVSPPFETKKELIDYLAENGDFWDQKRCKEPNWSRLWGGTPGVSAWGTERAKAFVDLEFAPSMVTTGGKVLTNAGDIAIEMKPTA